MVAPVLARLIAAGIVKIAEAVEGEVAEKLEEIEIPVSSSAISRIGYRGDDTITVTFHRGGTYTYEGDKMLFLAFAASSSKGKFFNDHFQVR
jgi:hypothetical protein